MSRINVGGVSLSVAWMLMSSACGGSPPEGTAGTTTAGTTTTGSSADDTTPTGGAGPETGADTPGTADGSATGTDTSPTGVTTTDATSDGATTTTTTTTSGSEATGSSGPADTGETGETGGSTAGTTAGVDDESSGTGGSSETGDETTGGGLWGEPNLWYSVDDALMYIEIDPLDGGVVALVHNQLVPDVALQHGQNGLTMLEGGALLGSREAASGTQIYVVPEPPTTPNTPAMAKVLGVVPSDMPQPLRIEALYTDCDGRVYLMDTGADVTNPIGNRMLRFTGDYLAGDLAFEVITDLQMASVGDIDDMSPGVVNGEITDSLGFAMDSATLWQVDYTTGTGMALGATDGTWGIHALGGPLFADLMPRLYILSAGDPTTGAELMEVYLGDYSNSQPLVEGPDLDLMTGANGWSGLAGPLTECMTTIPQ